MQTFDALHDRRKSADRREDDRRSKELNSAIEQDQVEIVFQPQFACGDNRLVGAEALSRWNHPVLGRIGAEALFDIAQRAGQVARLTHHIAERSLAAAANWPEPLELSLNVTAYDLADEGFAEAILAALDAARFPPRRLTLEITEQALVSDLDSSAAMLGKLTSQGIAIALDDFGAGFCNFRYLKRLPLSRLKLDRCIVEGIDENPRDLSILNGILALAVALEVDVTAEGIEHQGQLDVIVREGCAKWQGFLGGAPMTAAEFELIALR